jgi:hypothetical protein
MARLVKQQMVGAAKRIGGTGSFPGWLYDGKKKMAHASRERFMTFQVPSGEHDFNVCHGAKKTGFARGR